MFNSVKQLTFVNPQLSGIKYIHTAMQPLFISRSFSSSQTKTLSLLTTILISVSYHTLFIGIYCGLTLYLALG